MEPKTYYLPTLYVGMEEVASKLDERVQMLGRMLYALQAVQVSELTAGTRLVSGIETSDLSPTLQHCSSVRIHVGKEKNCSLARGQISSLLKGA